VESIVRRKLKIFMLDMPRLNGTISPLQESQVVLDPDPRSLIRKYSFHTVRDSKRDTQWLGSAYPSSSESSVRSTVIFSWDFLAFFCEPSLF
jgi:hypothetical protein